MNEMYLDELYHHGVKGQKWGVRRYQNKDGTHTPAGRIHAMQTHRARSAAITKKDVDAIIDSMSKDDKNKVLAGYDHYLTEKEGSTVVKRFLKKDGDVPVSFIDLLEEDTKTINVTLGTRSGDAYRGKGYGSEVTDAAMKWVKRNKNKLSGKKIVWGVRVDNAASIHLAVKNGFVIDTSSYSDDGNWVNYELKL